MFRRWVPVLIAAVFFVIAFVIMLDQKTNIGLWFQLRDLHHETFAIAAAAVGIGVIIGSLVTENKATVARRIL